MIYRDLISNIALLLALSILYSFLTRRWKREELMGQIIGGLLFGGVAIAGMLSPFRYAPGVIFDGRSIVLSMAGLFGGWLVAAIAAIVASAYRLWLGGAGALTGVGVAITSAALGLAYRHLRKQRVRAIPLLHLFAFGVVVHIAMLLWMLTLPWPLAFDVLRTISVPVMTIFPLGTLFLGILLTDQEKRTYAEQALRESEARYRLLVETSPYAIGIHQDGKIVFVNQAGAALLGASDPRELIGKPIRETVHPDDWEATRGRLQRLLAGQESLYPVENRLVRLDGSVVPVQVTAVPFTYQGKPAVQTIALDISVQKQAEMEIRRRTEELTVLNELERRISTTLALDDVASAAVEGILDATQADVAFLLLRGGSRSGDEPQSGFSETLLLPVEIRFREAGKSFQHFPTHQVGACLCGLAVQEGQAIYSADLHSDPRCTWEECKRAGLRSGAALPLFHGKRVFGVVGLGSEEEHDFAQQAEFLETLAAEVANGLQNALLYQRERQQRQEAETLRRVAAALTASLDLEAVLDNILTHLAEVIPYDSASLFLHNGGLARMIAGRGLPEPEKLIGIEFPLTNYFKRTICETRRPLIIPDAMADSRFQPWEGVDYIRGWMLIPLVVHEEVIGHLSVDSRVPDAYNQTHARLAEAFAQQAAIAIENARLHERAQRYAAELEQRVAERTAELQTRVEEVEHLNNALANLLEDLRTAKARLEHNAIQLQRTNEELEAFVYSVSHDLRAPLRAMEGFAQALLEDYADRFDETGQEYAQRIVAAAQRMEILINDLLQYSRLGRMEVRLEPVSLKHVVASALAQLEQEIQDRNADVQVAYPLPEVLGHPRILEQILANLLANAIKFVAPNVRPQVRLWAEEGNGRVRIWVEDNGIGIAPEHQERIFRIFERLHGIEAYPGTGVGLALVQRGVERLGGRCGVESGLGKGSRFWIEISKSEED